VAGSCGRYFKLNWGWLWFHVLPLRGKLRLFFVTGSGQYRVSNTKYKTYMCIICGWIYDEEKGAPAEGLAPGTRWEDVPDSWVCPDCGAGKEDFDLVQL
jgi:rubredoxin